MPHLIKRILILFVICAGGLGATILGLMFVRDAILTRSVLYPLPHQIPTYPGGISFRFAMVHDVVHERYPRHGNAYYQERNRLVLAAIDRHKGADGLPPFDRFGLVDDLAVGLNALGRSDEAIRWMRLKLQAQEKLGLNGRELYTSYANLG